jgi:DNA topoisomerase IA
MLVESSSKVILAMKIRDSRITNSKIGDEVKIKTAKVLAKKTKPPIIYNGSKLTYLQWRTHVESD